MVAFSVGLRRALHTGHGTTWGPLLFGIFGLALLFSGIFNMDPMQGYPAGAPSGIYSDVSWQHLMHVVFGIVVFLSLPLVCFVFARRFAKQPARRRGWTLYSTLTGLALLALFFIFGTAWENDSPVGGLIQRAMLIIGLGWASLLSVHLSKTLKQQ